MFKITKYFIPLLIFSLLIFFLWRGLSIKPNELPSALIGKSIPAFRLPSLLHPNQMIDTKDFQGKVIVLNVWASWCYACKFEHPQLEKLSKHPNVAVYGLNYKDKPEQAKHWLRRYGNPYQHIAVDENGSAAINLGVYGTPETFIIDKRGTIRLRHVGSIDDETLYTKILPEIDQLHDER